MSHAAPAVSDASSLWPALSAVATTAAVLVALFRDAFYQWWLRPKLLLNQLDDAHEASSRSRKPHDLGNRLEIWQLMAVSNVGRGRTANNVEVLALDIAPLDSAADPPATCGASEIKNYGLKWSLLPTRRLNIAAGTERWIDVVFTIQLPDRPGRQKSLRLLCLAAKDDEWLPVDRPLVQTDWQDQGHVLEAGAYRVHLAVTAEDIRARHYDVDVCLKTATVEPDFQKALSILACRTRDRSAM
jgi:hypothetical protein